MGQDDGVVGMNFEAEFVVDAYSSLLLSGELVDWSGGRFEGIENRNVGFEPWGWWNYQVEAGWPGLDGNLIACCYVDSSRSFVGAKNYYLAVAVEYFEYLPSLSSSCW